MPHPLMTLSWHNPQRVGVFSTHVVGVFMANPQVGERLTHELYSSMPKNGLESVLLIEADGVYPLTQWLDIDETLSRVRKLFQPGKHHIVIARCLPWLEDREAVRKWREVMVNELKVESYLFFENAFESGLNYRNTGGLLSHSNDPLLNSTFRHHPLELDTVVVVETTSHYTVLSRTKHRGEDAPFESSMYEHER